MRSILLRPAFVLWVTLVPALAAADTVVPSEKVRTRVMVREAPERGAPVVGSLRPGEEAEYLGPEPAWRRVRLASGEVGFVSEGWTRLVEEPAPPPAPEAPAAAPRSRLRRFLERTFGALFRPPPPEVSLVVRDPEPGLAEYRNTEPDLPVAGFAQVVGGGIHYDVVLAIDLSTSTNESAHADVNGDGDVDDGWMGQDSIFSAQIRAAAALVRSVEELPRNRNGQRIRVGIVTYSGEERFRLHPDDQDLEVSDVSILRLARRDARTRLALTSDYGAARHALATLARVEPVGMTNVAAGVGRALIELQGLEGARSQPRPEAQRVILFLTDGKPRLPYDRQKAKSAATWAGRMATDAGVRINAFALGENAVTRSRNDSIKRMARRTGGSYRALERPAEVVEVLRTTPFSLVESVRILNRTTERSTRRIATGIDGSFYGEIPLQPGDNEIELVAALDDDREVSHVFAIRYVQGLPARELEEQLKRIRIENEALIGRIQEDLAVEVRRARQKQRRQLEVTAQPSAAAAP